MRQLKVFETNYNEAVSNILKVVESRDADEQDLIELVAMFLETDANPYGFCPDGWASSFYSAQGFDSLINMIHHAMYDDGDITFFVVNREPRFGFFPSYDMNDENCLNSAEKQFKLNHGNEYSYRSVSCSEWIKTFRTYHSKQILEWFVNDAARYGVKFASQVHSKYANFDPDWEDSPEVLQLIDKKRNLLKAVGILS